MTSKPKRSNKIRKAPGARTKRLPHSPLSRLKAGMDVYEFTAADELLAAFRMANGLPVARDPDLDIPLALRFDAADEHQAKRNDLVRVYETWRRDLAGTQPLRIVDAVLFAEIPLSDIDANQRWRKGTAREHLTTALRHFAALRGNTPRGVRGWKFEPPAKEKTHAQVS